MELNTDNHDTPGIAGKNLLVMSVGSALIYLIIAWLIFRFIRGEELAAAFDHGYVVASQLGIGVLSGAAATAVISFLMSRWPISEVLYDYYIVRVISRSRFTIFDRLHLSLFAGMGEELLFRGAIQPLLGVWLTSLLFIGIHGYFKFQKTGHYLFGLMMFGLSMLLGYLFEYAGLLAAMTAHAVYDLIMLQRVAGKDKSNSDVAETGF